MTATNDVVLEVPALIRAEGVTLTGTVALPRKPIGVVLFANTRGSGFSQVDDFLARALRLAGFATLRFDLLNQAEAADPIVAQDAHLLAQRLLSATGWAEHFPETAGLPLAYVGSGLGGAAALLAAAEGGQRVSAVVLRNGRIELAGDALPRVTAATLFIVRNVDPRFLEMTCEALPRLGGDKELAIIPGVAPFLEEPRALDQLAWLTAGWCSRYLTHPLSPRARS